LTTPGLFISLHSYGRLVLFPWGNTTTLAPNAYGLATLACIITSTPGTLWVDFNEASGTLTIHVLDLVDETEWVRTIKGRYERPLLEIFA